MVRRTALPMSTARGVALLRAMEMHRPPEERISSDPFAASFVPSLFVQFTRAYVASGMAGLLGLEPMMNFAMLRERYVEDVMRQRLAAGVRQIVILGAGYDTRAYRLVDIGGARIFEVDHPVTQAAKRKVLAGTVALPANVTMVAVDFDRDDLGAQLALAGYDEAVETLFVWQGVIMYLTQEGIDQTLRFIASHSPHGSTLVFDTFYADTLASRSNAALRLFTRAMGERVTFGIGPSSLRDFLQERGFTDIHLVEGEDLRKLYPGAAISRRPVATDSAIVTATVAGAR